MKETCTPQATVAPIMSLSVQAVGVREAELLSTSCFYIHGSELAARLHVEN